MKKLTFLLLALFSVFQSYSQNTELLWTIENQTYQAGDTVKVEFRVHYFDSISCYQFAVQYDTTNLLLTGLELPDPTSIPMANLGDSMIVDLTDTLYIPNCIMGDFGFCKVGQVRHVWSYIYSATTDDNSLIFTLYFVAKEDGILSEFLEPAPNILSSAAYDFELNYMPLNIVFVDNINQQLVNEISPEEIPFRIYPNPFNDFVIFDNDIKDNMVKIFRVDGELIYVGNNINILNTSSFERGVYFFNVNGAIYKMIK